MPRGDRTGPLGMGPMTGRGAGYCAGYDAPGFVSSFGGAGFGRGGGRGGGWRGRGGGRGGWRHRHWFNATGLPGWQRAAGAETGGFGFAGTPPATKEQMLSAMKQQAAYLKETLEELNSRINELAASEEKK
jgi:hypothetical protein